MANTSTAIITTITEEEAHFDTTDRIWNMIKGMSSNQEILQNKVADLQGTINTMLTFFIILIITTIVLTILITYLIKQNKAQKNIIEKINIQNNNEEKQITLSEQDKEILELVKANPEKAETIIKLLK